MVLTSAAKGLAAEDTACNALTNDGFTILGRRLRTPAGEIDIVAATAVLLVFVEVKHRPSLAGAALSLAPRQQARLVAAAEILLAAQPGWHRPAMRFDVIVVDGGGRVRRITDALRQE
jgi:putative endonuclease